MLVANEENEESREAEKEEEQQKLEGSLKHLHQEITEHIHPYVATKIEKIIPKEIDIWTGRKIAEKLGFIEHPKEDGLYFRDRYSKDFEGGDEDSEFITCYHTGAQTDKCIVSASHGDCCVCENEIMRTYGKYPCLKKFIELRNDVEKAKEFLMKEGQDVD